MHTIPLSVFESRSIHGPCLREDMPLPGSPERCLERAVFEDDRGRFWVLEKVHPSAAEHGERMARLLSRLSGNGCAYVHPYRVLPSGRHLNQAGDFFLRVSPYIAGTEPERPAYIRNAAMGRSLGRCLGAIRRASEGVPAEDLPAEPFDPGAYAAEILEAVRRRNPPVHARAARIAEWADPFSERAADGPAALCHGDFHPLNVVWQGEEIRGVIDWEFAGMKHELHDAAVATGCVGIEHPAFLERGFVPAFLSRLRHERILTPDNEPDLLPLVVCMRFAWLSEWLRRRDAEMIEMELDYMDILTGNAERIRAAWRK